MTMITSYDQAVALFATARKPEAGKPLGPKDWRMYKHGDEFAIYYTRTMVARLLPGNLLRMVLPDDARYPQGISYKVWAVLPVVLHRRSQTSAKLHVILSGNEGYTKDAKLVRACGYSTWHQFSTAGYKLYDGLTIDLTTRMAVGYREPTYITDADSNKDWLRKSKRLKLHLRTAAKLGGFDAHWQALDKATLRRWEYEDLRDVTDASKSLLLSALEGDRLSDLMQALTGSLARTHHQWPTVAEQIKHIDRIFANHSLALRKSLGVITRA